MQYKNICKISEITKISSVLQRGKIAVLPTDTIYGLHCLAVNQKSIEQINELKGRGKNTPYITLISDISDLKKFNIDPSKLELKIIKKLWPGRNTIIFTRDETTRSFRLPDNKFLIALLKITGPLISTSANKHGEMPASSVEDAYTTFGNKVDIYVDGGILDNPASSIYKIENGEAVKIR